MPTKRDAPSAEQIHAMILRRADFLLNEARSPKPLRDQTVTYAMRVISNYCSIGKDAGSSQIKRANQRISRSAFDLKRTLPFNEWARNTINEHQEPLKLIWNWILTKKDELNSDKVLDRFKEFPMIIITRKENDRLNELGLREKGDPEQRYREANIEILDVANLPLETEAVSIEIDEQEND